MSLLSASTDRYLGVQLGFSTLRTTSAQFAAQLLRFGPGATLPRAVYTFSTDCLCRTQVRAIDVAAHAVIGEAMNITSDSTVMGQSPDAPLRSVLYCSANLSED